MELVPARRTFTTGFGFSSTSRALAAGAFQRFHDSRRSDFRRHFERHRNAVHTRGLAVIHDFRFGRDAIGHHDDIPLRIDQAGRAPVAFHHLPFYVVDRHRVAQTKRLGRVQYHAREDVVERALDRQTRMIANAPEVTRTPRNGQSSTLRDGGHRRGQMHERAQDVLEQALPVPRLRQNKPVQQDRA